MMKDFYTYKVLLYFVLFSILISSCAISWKASASPSFNRQEIKDNAGWFLGTNLDNTFVSPSGEKFTVDKVENIDQCKTSTKGFSFPNISSVSYLSDGKILNATIWLSSPLYAPYTNGSLQTKSDIMKLPWHNLGYTMSIDVKSVYKIGTDYFVHISWNPVTQTWNRDITEGATSVGEGRFIEQVNNVKDFYEEGKNYVLLSLDLKKIGSPDQYNLLWSSRDFFIKNNHLCELLDVSNWAQAPPPGFTTSTTPNPIILRQGDKTTVEIEIKSATDTKSNAFLYTPDVAGLELNLVNNQAAIPPTGIGTLLLNVKASQDALPHTYTIPLYQTFSFPTVGTLAGTQSFSNLSANITDISYFTVTVQPSLTPEQSFSTFWSTYGGIASLASGAVISTVVKLVFDKIQAKRKSKSEQKTSVTN